MIKRYGWRRDLPDARDLTFDAPAAVLEGLPTRVDLRRDGLVPMVDRRGLGSAVVDAVAGVFVYLRRKHRVAPDFVPSRLFLYYEVRVRAGTVPVDAGGSLRDAMKVLRIRGACPASGWPDDVARFAERPPDAAYREAARHRVAEYRRVPQSLIQLKGCLAAGAPFAFGFSVYESFEGEAVRSTGKVPVPSASERLVAGHAAVAVGYDDDQQRFIVRNSWGIEWGDRGDCYLPYAYLSNGGLAADFWTLTASKA